MIDINFIPDNLRKRKRRDFSSSDSMIPLEVIVGVSGGVFVILFLIHCSLIFMWTFNQTKHAIIKAQWSAILPDKNSIDSLTNQLREVQKKVNAIKQVTQGQGLSWARWLNIISDSIPKEIWLRRIVLNDKSLAVEGTAVSKNSDEMINVGNFVTQLKNNPEFMEYIDSVEIENIQRRSNQMLDVADFVLMIKLK